MMKKILTLLFAGFLLGGHVSLQASEEAGYYTNPILDNGADPWVIKQGDYYYYCAVVAGGIGVSKSKYLYQINPPQSVWQHPDAGKWNSTNIWAPELHYVKGKWYIYYAAGYAGPPYIHQKTGVLESVTSDPLGEYIDRGMVFTGEKLNDWDNNRWAIDMTIFEQKGQLYAVWSGWEEAAVTDKTKQHIYIAKMSSPTTISSGRVKISSPDSEYEQGSLPLNEGPQMLISKKDIFVIYSCGQSWLPTYKLASLRLKSKKADPMKPENWIKSESPVFEGTDKVHGVGHACFTVSPDGKEHYIVYHSKKEAKSGWQRDVRLQKFTFDKSGIPVFGKPIPAGEKIQVPSAKK